MTTPASQPIRVMVVDDHTIVRRGLATFLKIYDDLQLAGEADSGASAIQLCGEILPDVILMDMVMPDMDGASAIDAIRKKHPQVQIIALTSFKEGSRIKKALEAGAIGYLRKERLPGNLLSPERMQACWPCATRPTPPGILSWKNVEWNWRSTYAPGFPARIAPRCRAIPL